MVKKVVIYPFIKEKAVFDDFWWRAKYYLPTMKLEGEVSICMGANFNEPTCDMPPSHFGAIPEWCEIELIQAEIDLNQRIADADIVLIWNRNADLPQSNVVYGRQIRNISLTDEVSKEYEAWGGLRGTC